MCARAADPARTEPTERVPAAATDSALRALPAAPVRPALTRAAWTFTAAGVRRGFGVGRLLLAVLGVVALAGYFDYVLGFATFQIYNYYSYFTVQSGMAAVVVFVAAAIVAFRHTTDPPWLDWFRLLVTTYITVSGIVFLTIVIQSSSLDYTIEVPWSSQLLHFWIPSIALLDWLTDAGKARLPWKVLVWVLVAPAIWGVFTLIRGSMVGWYPYFFLDPVQVSGPLETAIYCAVALLIFTAIAAVLTATSRLPPRPWYRTPPEPVTPLGAGPRLV
ncbi:MAG TPA: Pr6Pr family membrane protein [Cryobacterium sp.]|nr:Pr6Pr family membrane protein [Cryobacterium sp.]